MRDSECERTEPNEGVPLQDITRAKRTQNHVRSILGGSSTAMVPVPEIQDVSTDEAIHKLQIQIFALTDGLANLTAAVEELQTRKR